MINETDYTNNPLTKEQENQIDTLFAQYDRNYTSGCAVGVIKDGRFIYKKSFGMANLDYDIPITSESKFELASVSKQFYAACVALLYLDGKLDLDDDVRKYIPELPDYGKVITIKHLIYHTSGLRDVLDMMLMSGRRSEDYYHTELGLKLICQQKYLDFIPGEKYSYSSSGYLLLTVIVHRLSGKSMREYAEEYLFKPLGMNSTHFNDNHTDIIKNRVVSYDEDDGVFYNNYQNFVAFAGGNVITNLNDLHKWNNNFDTAAIGGKKFVELMVSQGCLDNKEKIEYGFGLKHGVHNGTPTIYHGGVMFGFYNHFVRFPAKSLSVIVLANCWNCDAHDLAYEVADIFIPESSEEISEELAEIKIEKAAVQLNQTEIDNICGSYWSFASQLNRKIYLKDDGLYYWRSENSESKLFPLSPNEFAIGSIESDSKFIMELDENNQKRLKMVNSKTCIAEFISFEPVSYTIVDLEKFTGKYYSEELDTNYCIAIESDKLVAMIRDQKIELEVIMENVFDMVIWEGVSVEFLCNDHKDIFGFRLDSERVKNIKFIKQS